MSQRAWVAITGASLLALLGAACSDDEPVKTEDTAAEKRSAPHRESWLQPGSPVAPAQWMASRNEERVRPVTDPEVRRLASLLDTANSLYRESERMIANRAVQLEGMLVAIGVKESAAEILDDLTSIAGEAGQTEGFGSVSQHYFNLRANKTSRSDALAALKSRYGTRRLP